MSSNDKLKQRILDGAVWLITNSYGWCQQFGKAYDPKKYERHLRLYEQLVDKARALGITETECLQIDDDLNVAKMSNDLILVYLCESSLKKRNRSITVSKLYKKL